MNKNTTLNPITTTDANARAFYDRAQKRATKQAKLPTAETGPKIVVSYIRTGRYFVKLQTGFKTSLRRKRATKFESNEAVLQFLRAEGISSEIVNVTDLSKPVPAV